MKENIKEPQVFQIDTKMEKYIKKFCTLHYFT